MSEFVNIIKSLLINGKLELRQVNQLALEHSITDKTEQKELIELAIVLTAREIALQQHPLKLRFEQIVTLYKNQVNLSHRTSQSIMLQQYERVTGHFAERQSTSFQNVKEGDYVEIYTGINDKKKAAEGKVAFKYGKHYLKLDNDNETKYNYGYTYYVVEPLTEKAKRIRLAKAKAKALILIQSQKTALGNVSDLLHLTYEKRNKKENRQNSSRWRFYLRASASQNLHNSTKVHINNTKVK